MVKKEAKMTYDEYKKELKELEETYQKKKKQLAFKYAMSNNSVKRGDIVTDHIGDVIVDKINVGGHSWQAIECVYEGFELTKQGKPFKNKRRRIVWQSNLKHVKSAGEGNKIVLPRG